MAEIVNRLSAPEREMKREKASFSGALLSWGEDQCAAVNARETREPSALSVRGGVPARDEPPEQHDAPMGSPREPSARLAYTALKEQRGCSQEGA